jgi:hypothetical protein
MAWLLQFLVDLLVVVPSGSRRDPFEAYALPEGHDLWRSAIALEADLRQDAELVMLAVGGATPFGGVSRGPAADKYTPRPRFILASAHL